MWLLLVGCIPEIDVTRPEDAPVAVLLEPAPGTTLDAGRQELRGMVSDAADAPERLFTTWQAGDDASTDDGGWETLCTGFAWEDGTTLCAADLRVDHTRLRLRVVDVAGFVGVAEAAVTVVAGASPQITLVAPAPGPWFANVDVPLELRVADLDDPVESLVVVVQSDLDGVLPVPSAPTPDGLLSAGILLSEGVHRLRVTAVDPGGRASLVEQVVYVEGLDAPPVVRLDRERWVQPDGSELTVSGSALDAEAPPEALTVSLWIDGGWVWSGPGLASGRVAVTLPDRPVGEYALVLQAQDPNGFVSEAHGTLLVDSPPTLTVISAPSRVGLGDPWVAELMVADARSASPDLVVELVSDVDGPRWTATPEADGRVMRATALSPGIHNLLLTAVDGDGLETSASLTVTVEE